MENLKQEKNIRVQQCGLYKEDVEKMGFEVKKVSTKKSKFSSFKQMFSRQKTK